MHSEGEKLKNPVLVLLGLVVLVSASFLVGRISSEKDKINPRTLKLIEEKLKEMEKGNMPSSVIPLGYDSRLNCHELKGDLCYDGGCALPFYDSTESFCCPIECDTCPSDFSCYDGDRCTEDICYVDNGESTCIFKPIVPCKNNGICEPQEIKEAICPYDPQNPQGCCPNETHSVIVGRTIEDYEKNDDCPETCDDGDPSTVDSYYFEEQRCMNIVC